MECFSRKYKSAKTESDDDWCFNLWKEVEQNFFKIKLVEWKVFKKKLFLDKRNVFFKKRSIRSWRILKKNLGFGTFRPLNFAIRSRQNDENGTFNDKREQLWVTNVSEKIPLSFQVKNWCRTEIITYNSIFEQETLWRHKHFYNSNDLFF